MGVDNASKEQEIIILVIINSSLLQEKSQHIKIGITLPYIKPVKQPLWEHGIL